MPSSAASMHISHGSGAYQSWCQCISVMVLMHTSHASSAYQSWYQCISVLALMRVSHGTNAYQLWHQCFVQAGSFWYSKKEWCLVLHWGCNDDELSPQLRVGCYALSGNQCKVSERYICTGIQTAGRLTINMEICGCWTDTWAVAWPVKWTKHQGTDTEPCRYLLHRRLCRLGRLRCTSKGWWPAWQPGPACQLLHSAAAALCSVLPPTSWSTPVVIAVLHQFCSNSSSSSSSTSSRRHWHCG